MKTMQSTQDLAAIGIRYRLFARQLSQRWLSDKLGWSVAKLQRRLQGAPTFKLDEIDRIAGIFGLTVGELLTVPDEMHARLAETDIEQAA